MHQGKSVELISDPEGGLIFFPMPYWQTVLINVKKAVIVGNFFYFGYIKYDLEREVEFYYELKRVDFFAHVNGS